MIKTGATRKHHIDIMFLMILFLIFTFSAVSVLLMAINSYKGVVNSSEDNASARVLCAYIREVVHQNDEHGKVSVDSFQGKDCIRISVDEEHNLYIYQYEDKLMELNASDDSGATLEFGDEIASINGFEVEFLSNENVIEVTLKDSYGNTEIVDIAVKSKSINGNVEEEQIDE